MNLSGRNTASSGQMSQARRASSRYCFSEMFRVRHVAMSSSPGINKSDWDSGLYQVTNRSTSLAWKHVRMVLTTSLPSVPDISGPVKNSIRHVCQIYPVEHPLFALLPGDRNILSMTVRIIFGLQPSGAGTAFDVAVKGLTVTSRIKLTNWVKV